MNTVILGYILRFLPIKKEVVERYLSEYFSGEKLKMNLKALNEGLKL